VLRASSRLAPSVLTTRPCDRPVRKTRDASNRLLPPVPLTCTRSPFVPGSADRFHDPGRPAQSEAARGLTEGADVFTTSEPLRPRCPRTRFPRAFDLAVSGHERGPIGPTALDGTEPLASPSRLPLLFTLTSPSCVLIRAQPLICFGACARVGRGGRRRGRLRNRLVKVDPGKATRDAFHRQGPFVGSGGHYSPGPATEPCPFERATRPLDDALTSPWALSRCFSVVVRRSPSSRFAVSPDAPADV